MRTLTYNPDSQKWIESDDGLEPEVPSTEWYLKVLRKKRNSLLKETDWWAVSDRTMTDDEKAYRQALRDLPANTKDPANPIFPTKP